MRPVRLWGAAAQLEGSLRHNLGRLHHLARILGLDEPMKKGSRGWHDPARCEGVHCDVRFPGLRSQTGRQPLKSCLAHAINGPAFGQRAPGGTAGWREAPEDMSRIQPWPAATIDGRTR